MFSKYKIQITTFNINEINRRSESNPNFQYFLKHSGSEAKLLFNK